MSENDATNLVKMLKELLDKKVYLPENGNKKDYIVKSKTSRDVFIININRRQINEDKCSFVARTKGKNELLLRLDVNPTAAHRNPDGIVIEGTHLHIFKENCELDYAIPFNEDASNLIEHCKNFFKKFNILEDYTVYDNTSIRLFH